MAGRETESGGKRVNAPVHARLDGNRQASARANFHLGRFLLIKVVETERLGRGGVVTPAFGNVQVAGVFDGRDGGGADGGQVGGPVAGTAGGMVFANDG
jgi:hypothetical protein